MKQHLIVDLVGQITDEDVEMVRGVFLVGGVGLIGPVDPDFLRFRYQLECPRSSSTDYPVLLTYRLMNPSSVQGLHGSLGCARVIVLDKAVVETLSLRSQ